MTRTRRTPPPACDPGVSLAEARSYVHQHRSEGVTCPCCDQRAQVYRRSITTQMARGLIALYRRSTVNVPIKLETAAGNNGALVRVWRGDFTKLRYWGFIKGVELTAEEQEEQDKRDSNMWAITDQGVEFVRRTIKTQRYAFVYNNRVIAFDGEMIDIKDALGNKFSYADIMGGTAI